MGRVSPAAAPALRCLTQRHAALLAAMRAQQVCAEVFVFAAGPEVAEADCVREAMRRLDEAQAQEAPPGPRIHWRDTALKGMALSWEALVGTPDALPRLVAKNMWFVPEADGLKTAFINPPHGRSGAEAEQRAQLYEQFVQEVLGPPQTLRIQQWDTTGCSYFDAGREWWGSFLWTLRRLPHDEVVVIAMTATD